ncbi:hypothetical protein ACWO08_000975 [Enterobacter hormaechei]|uniref:Replication protein n=1 Tax=Enterobacter intestinihominis TaxID=3133180 RepID=A0ABV1ZGH6_9ENTR|nr:MULTISPECIES: hypothetical protein [Enterobacteriaceae]EFE7534786.1 hypothetical protein [Escherichia coli]EJI0959222.1 hypothetical protein [Escherichia coli]ELM7943477.1 hypothetical protein [Escherichia coli]ELM7948161.1 hypothetical protein [Escherichia coli]ELM7957909.1 hypothetical protein [Escherichia coli]
MFGAKDRIARSVYVSLTEEERQLEKLALTIPGFETRDRMEKERQYRIRAIQKAVQQDRNDNENESKEVRKAHKKWRGKALRLKRKLKACMLDKPCGSAACPQCFRLHRLRKLAELAPLRGCMSAYRVVTLVYYDAMLEEEQISCWDHKKFRERVYKMVKRAGFTDKIVGGYELDFHTDIQRWMPHLHLLMPREPGALKTLRKAMKRDKNIRARAGIISRPMKSQKLRDFDAQVTYCFKGMWQEVRPYSDEVGKRRTRKHRLPPVLLARALCKQDEMGFTGLTFTSGVRTRK